MNRRTAVLVVLLGLLIAGCTTSVLAPVDRRGAGGILSSEQYTVRRGDTLYSIAWRHGVDFRSVARWNHIEPPYVIYPGQRLRLSAPAASVAARSPAPTRRESPSPAKKPAAAPAKPPPAPEATAAELAWRWPVEGKVVKGFAADGNGKLGIEIAGADAQAVRAAADGRVVYSGSGLRGYGNLVIIKHNSRYLTAYGYNRDLLVKEGDSVAAGQRIATMGRPPGGDTARIHFELRRDGKAVDPLSYLPRR